MFLVKEEPENYSFDAFVTDGGTRWSGVKNPLAQKHLRGIRKGDEVFYYHTGKEKAAVGIAEAMPATRIRIRPTRPAKPTSSIWSRFVPLRAPRDARRNQGRQALR